jgi:uncharacterized RDD family membrane protein YckC
MEKATGHQPKPCYAGFWLRLGALLADAVFLLPLIFVVRWGQNHFRLFELYWLAPNLLLNLFLHVYLVGRFGGSPGKLVLGIRITRVDGSRVGYARALLREAPTLVLYFIYVAGLALPLLSMSEAQYQTLNHHHQYTELARFAPTWVHWFDIANQVWIWSEFLVMLTNGRRRALHDFLAGTVVIRRRTASLVNAQDALTESGGTA